MDVIGKNNHVEHPIPAELRAEFDAIELAICTGKGSASRVFTQMRTAVQAHFMSAAPAAPVVQEPVAWALPDPNPSAQRPFLVLFHSPSQVTDPGKLVPLYAAPPAPDAALVEALESMTCAYRMAIQAGYARITELGGDCDSVERMLAAFPEYGRAVALCKELRAALAGKGGE